MNLVVVLQFGWQNMLNKIILITGASGGGKTTILKELEKMLSKEQVSINYFDDIGIPSFEDMTKE